MGSSALPDARVGVLVVAYNAAATLAAVLERLPAPFRARVDHVLVCDDASADDTFEQAVAYQATSDIPLTVVRHPVNLGYGGNQQHGYRWAIERGLDIVVLLHGDGQYAPEVIENLVAPLEAGEADAVFGSRMLTKGGVCRRDADLQVRRQPHSHHRRESSGGSRSQRVAQRLSRLSRRCPGRHPVRAELDRVRLRHRDHHPAPGGAEAHPRGPDPDLLRRRDLSCQRARLRPRRRDGRHPVPASQARVRYR